MRKNKVETAQKHTQKEIIAHESKSSVWHFNFDSVENWAYWDNLFTPEECEKIIKVGISRHQIIGTTINNDIEKVRKSNISWLVPDDDTRWVFERVAAVITNLNERFFKFELTGMAEGFQFTTYEAPGGKYDKHIDKFLHKPVRKLSFVLQLTDPSKYTGGDLELFFSDKAEKIPRDIGYAVLFPSYVLHRVTPVTKGTRHSLVSWITGPSFK